MGGWMDGWMDGWRRKIKGAVVNPFQRCTLFHTMRSNHQFELCIFHIQLNVPRCLQAKKTCNVISFSDQNVEHSVVLSQQYAQNVQRLDMIIGTPVKYNNIANTPQNIVEITAFFNAVPTKK